MNGKIIQIIAQAIWLILAKYWMKLKNIWILVCLLLILVIVFFLALANALGIQFIVFTTQKANPVLHIMPQEITCGFPVYLAYTHISCDAVVSVSEQELPLNTTSSSCTCGVNAKRIKCPNWSEVHISLRCSCLKDSKACTVLCKWKNCGNGKVNLPEMLLCKRCRYDHQLQ